MPRSRSPNRDKALELYIKHNGDIENRQIANILSEKEKTISNWKCRDKWNTALQCSTTNTESSTKKQKGAQPGNKNAIGNTGGRAPKGNLNPIKHGAYQNVYLDALPQEERELYEQIDPSVELNNEIKLLRLKITRLLNRDKTFFYDMFGTKHDIEIKEEDREQGIVICIHQLEKLVRTKAAILTDTVKFEYQQHKDEIELEIKLARLELDKAKANMDDGNEIEDDGFLAALTAEVGEVWKD